MKIRTLILGAAALAIAGCSSLQPGVQNFGRNLAAADCATPASQQTFLDNLPPNPFVTAGQQKAILQQACVGLFGTVAAPVTAAGNAPALPSIVAPLAAPVSPLPASK